MSTETDSHLYDPSFRDSDVQIVDSEPVDKFNLVYLSMILLGCGLLFPYNAMITASDYFDHIWEGKHLSSFAPLLSTCLSPFLQLFMVRFSHLLPYRLRVIGGFALYTLSTIAVPLVAENIKDRNKSYVLAMGLMIIIGASNAILSSTIFAMAAVFPPKYLQAVMAGNGWSGLIVCLIRIVTKAIFKEDDRGFRMSAISFFGSASFVCLACIFAYLFIVNTTYSSRYFSEKLVKKNSSSINDENDSLLDMDLPPKEEPTMLQVISKAWPMLLNIWAVFFMTFIVFPGTILAHDSSIKWLPQSWFPVTAITMFNVFDLIGRSMPAYVLLFSVKTLPIGVFSRFILYPFFIFLGPANVIESTWILFIVLIIFSITNGFISTLCFVHSGSYVSETERALLGGLMSVCLSAGITSGSLVSNAIGSLAFK